LRSCWIWLMSSRDIPAEMMASSCVQSNTTTQDPSADGVASQLSPSLENENLDNNSVAASSSMSSTTSFPSSRHLTASCWLKKVVLEHRLQSI
jgi:hypothetical protein